MHSILVAFCLNLSEPYLTKTPNPGSKILLQHVVIGGIGSLAPIPLAVRRSSTVTRVACGSSGEGISIDNCDKMKQHPKENDPSMLLELMSPMASAKPDQMSASSLAYLGDVLYELFVRSRYIWPSRRMSDLQNKVVSIVRAEAQSLMLQKFIELFPLTPIEQSVLARGRNANLTASKKGKGANATAFQDSSAFEALLGWTFICDKHRFSEMISWMKKELDELDAEG